MHADAEFVERFPQGTYPEALVDHTLFVEAFVLRCLESRDYPTQRHDPGLHFLRMDFGSMSCQCRAQVALQTTALPGRGWWAGAYLLKR